LDDFYLDRIFRGGNYHLLPYPVNFLFLAAYAAQFLSGIGNLRQPKHNQLGFYPPTAMKLLAPPQ
jgi:hypothetical protein